MHGRKHHFYIGLLIVITSVINVFIFSSAWSKVAGHTGTRTFTGGMLAATSSAPIVDDVLPTSTPATSTVLAVKKHGVNFNPVKILHFGDAMFDRGVRKNIDNGVDPFSSLRSVDIMSDYAIRMLNLEGPITAIRREVCQQKELNFQFPTTTALLLRDANFTGVTMANNHMLDCNQEGLDESVRYIKDAGLFVTGYPTTARTWVDMTMENGTSVAIVGVDATIGAMPLDGIPQLIADLKRTHDIVLVTVHWGDEYALRANATQKALAHTWIDAGADVIIGNHPHVVENVENYKGHAIFYALGNFIFDQIGVKENEGMGVGMTLYSGSAEFMIYPYTITHATPTFLSPLEANKWCAGYLGVMPNISPDGCTFSLTTEE